MDAARTPTRKIVSQKLIDSSLRFYAFVLRIFGLSNNTFPDLSGDIYSYVRRNPDLYIAMIYEETSPDARPYLQACPRQLSFKSLGTTSVQWLVFGMTSFWAATLSGDSDSAVMLDLVSKDVSSTGRLQRFRYDH